MGEGGGVSGELSLVAGPFGALRVSRAGSWLLDHTLPLTGYVASAKLLFLSWLQFIHQSSQTIDTYHPVLL